MHAPAFKVFTDPPTTVQTFGVVDENSSDSVFESGILKLVAL
jgi:hypothetical protein